MAGENQSTVTTHSWSHGSHSHHHHSPRIGSHRRRSAGIGSHRQSPAEEQAQRNPERQTPQQQEEQEERANRRGPVSMAQFHGMKDTLIAGVNDGLLSINEYQKLEQGRIKKRALAPLLRMLEERHTDLMGKYQELCDVEVIKEGFNAEDDIRGTRQLCLKRITYLKEKANELAQGDNTQDPVRGSPNAKRRYFQEKLKSEYPVSCDLFAMSKYVSALPETLPEADEEIDPSEVGEKISKMIEKGADMAEEDSKMKSILEGAGSIFSVILSGYQLFKYVKEQAKRKDIQKREYFDIFRTTVEKEVKAINSVVDMLETFGVKALKEVVPILGAAFGILVDVLNGIGTIMGLIFSAHDRSALVQRESAITQRMMKNREKEASFGNTIALSTEMKGTGLFGWGPQEERMVAGRESQEAMRQNLRASVTGANAGGSTQNIYMRKVQLKQERSRLLAAETPDMQRLAELDAQIGQLRMAQDADRLGTTTEGKVKQNIKIRSGVETLVVTAADLAAQIAKLCPGIGSLVGETIDKVVKIYGLGRKAASIIMKWFPKQKLKQQKKDARRESLASAMVDQMNMLASPEFDLNTLEGQPAENQDETVLKAAYKGYEDLNATLKYSLGISPKTVMLGESKEVVRKVLASGFSAGG